MSDFKDLQAASNKEVVQSGTQIQESRAVAEIQAAVLMAKQNPRNQNQAYLNIMDACKRGRLAEQAMYAYPRGNQMVRGPSIRMAEVLAREWGNCRVGITIQSQDKDKTEARAYAYDLQTNYMIDQDFTVPHKRTTKKGVKVLTDERDIRELVANIGSRHLRGCILRLIPADIVDDAVEQIGRTLATSDVPIAERIKQMVTAFSEFGVKPEHLEQRLGHKLDATIPEEIVTLKGIFKSLKDGMAKREDFFDDFKKDEVKEAKAELKQMLDNNEGGKDAAK